MCWRLLKAKMYFEIPEFIFESHFPSKIAWISYSMSKSINEVHSFHIEKASMNVQWIKIFFWIIAFAIKLWDFQKYIFLSWLRYQSKFFIRKYILKFIDYITSWSDAFSMFENNPRQHLQNQHLALFVEVFFFVRCKTRYLPEGYYFNSLQSHVLANLTNRYAGLERHVFFLGVWWVWMVNMLK